MSGFGQIPSSGVTPPQNTGRAERTEPVRIIRLPDALQNNARTLRVEGTVTQSNNNGTVRIQTERGAIDVQFPNQNARSENNQPQQGQRLELTIPAGRPPRQATVDRGNLPPDNRAAQQTQQPQIQARGERPLPQGAQSTQQNSSQVNTPARIQNSTLPNTALPQGAQSTSPAPTQQSFPPAPLNQGAAVRLVSIPPGQAIQIATQSLNALTPIQNLVTQTSFSANITAQNAVNQIGQTTLTIGANKQNTPITPILTNTPALNVLANNNLQPIQTSQFFTPQSLTTLTGTQTTPLATSAPNNITFTSQLVLTTPQLTTLPNAQNALVNFQPNASLIPTGASQPNAIGKIDIQVLAIQNNNVILSPPSNSGAAQQSVPALTSLPTPVTSNTPAVNLTAQVTGFTPQGQPLITLQLPGAPLPQSFILQYTPNNLVIGSQLQIAVQNVSAAPLTAPLIQTQSPALAPLLGTFQWGAFDEAVQALIQQSPAAATSLLRALPTAANPTQLGAVGAAAMAAIRGGDLANWLGDRKVDAIQRLTRGANILSRLTQDTAAPRAEAASNTDWRAVPLPMFWEGEIHKITLFMRQENQQQDQQNEGNGSTRFIFDLSLSRMGEVQLDGYLKEKRLDLVIRTQNGFSQPMQQTMRSAYSGALSQAAMSGDLTFQGHTNNWVHVLKDEENFAAQV
ncbi:MAG: hypothetical protein AAF204_04975 [Pseudomonadota bacterium]